MSQLLVAGDIGATKADLAVVSAGGGRIRLLAEATYESRSHAGLVELVSGFLRGVGVPVRHAAFSVAGPVVDGEAWLPNLGWQVDGEEVREALSLRAVKLVNDLQATARTVPHLAPAQLLTLQEGLPRPGGLQAVIAPGTGLGEALLVPEGTDYVALPSEGGHTDFAPADEEQRELLVFLQAEFGHVSYERVCSGTGIANIYRFLRVSGRARDEPEVAARIVAAADPTPLIVETGLRPGSAGSASARALEIFAAILGAEAGNLALRALATGGVLIGGGLPPRLARVLKRGAFLRAFRHKGPMSDLVACFPIRLIREPRAALWGAIHYGIGLLDAAEDPLPEPPAAAT